MRVLLLHECNSGQSSYIPVKGDDPEMYAKIGKWLMRSTHRIVETCVNHNIKPCIHVMPRRIKSRAAMRKIDDACMTLEKEWLIKDVERG